MANQSIYAAFERMWQHLSDRLEEYKPEGLATEEYVDNKIAGLVDGAPSYLNTLKELANAINNDPQFASNVSTNITDVKFNVDDLETLGLMTSNSTMRLTEIATNPRGAVMREYVIMEEIEKIKLGMDSDKLFVLGNAPDQVMLIKLSDKVPAYEEFSKGFMAVFGYMIDFNFTPSFVPFIIPYMSISIGSIDDDESGWDSINGSISNHNGYDVFFDGAIAAVYDNNNSLGIPIGLYTLYNPAGLCCLGLQINGFDLNSSAAPVTKEDLGDINDILDSIIGEEVWTFTLEDGSTVDKVVISSD